MGLKGFETYYQPIVDTKTRRLVGAEALMRFSMPERCEDGETKKEAVCVGEDGHDADEKVHWERISPVEVYSSVRGDRSDHSGRKMDAASGNLDLQQVAEIHSEFPHQYQSFLCAGHEEPCPDGDTDSAAPVWIRAFRGGN